MRQREYLNPDEMRELDALDRVLAGEPVDADLRELEDLVLDIRATAPEMTPGFAARLAHEVSDGFPTREQIELPRRRRRWMLVPAAGTLATVAIALVVVLGQNGDDGADTLAAKPNTTGALVDEAVAEDSSSSAAVPQAAEAPALKRQSRPLPPRSSQVAPPLAPTPSSASRGATTRSSAGATATADRKVERNAQIVLEAPRNKVQSTADAVIRTVDRFGGIVQSSSSSSSDGSGGEATFDLRFPTDKLDEALSALSKLGHVAERSQSLQDITGSFTSAQDRLADARAERRGLLRALGRATTPQQLQSLRSRLRLVRSTIARLNGQLASLRRRADLSTVALTIRGTGKVDEGAGSGGTWTPADAAGDALRVLEVIAGVALIALAIAAPFTLLGAAIMLGVRAARRRRRDGALDPA